MLQFHDEFFCTENRDGFVVNELMKRSWAAQMEVLGEIDRICRKHSITWFAYYGTLLGAVRHEGFIPWDDDIDIAMKRDDYIRFLQVARQELPEKFCVLNIYTEKEYENAFTRITNEHGINFAEEHMDKYHNCPFVAGVDIFPLYYIPRDPEQAGILDALIELIRGASRYEQNGNVEAMQECLATLEEVFGYQFSEERSIHSHMTLLFDRVGRMYGKEESDEMTIFAEYIRNGYRVKAEWLEEMSSLPFENIMINVPRNYGKILKGLFPDYMTPRREYDTHEYPFYKNQLLHIRRYVEKQNLVWKQNAGRQLEANWQERIAGRKVVLFHTNVDSMMRYHELAINRIREVLQEVQKREDVILWWVPCLLDTSEIPFVKRMVPELVNAYEQIINDYCSTGYGIYDITSDVNRAIEVADYYYGDEGELAQLFRESGKNVTIQNYEG